MIDKKLLEKAKKMWIDVNVEILSKKWLSDEVINEVLEWSIDWREWKDEFYTLEETKVILDKKFNSNVVECIN